MQLKIGPDGKGLQIRFSNAEFKKLRRDANGVGVELREYIDEVTFSGLLCEAT